MKNSINRNLSSAHIEIGNKVYGAAQFNFDIDENPKRFAEAIRKHKAGFLLNSYQQAKSGAASKIRETKKQIWGSKTREKEITQKR